MCGGVGVGAAGLWVGVVWAFGAGVREWGLEACRDICLPCV